VKAAVVVTTPKYEREVGRLLTESERASMEDAIASEPAAHPVVPGTGGVRKARWGRQGKGKRGGVRVIYYYWVSATAVYMLWVYSKTEQSNMTAAERKAARKFVEALRNAENEDR
jgi:mRNA-degrading endonuclease RelE of RelBE toxin-antitoxin system